jgi:hypothetical protein
MRKRRPTCALREKKAVFRRIGPGITALDVVEAERVQHASNEDLVL